MYILIKDVLSVALIWALDVPIFILEGVNAVFEIEKEIINIKVFFSKFVNIIF